MAELEQNTESTNVQETISEKTEQKSETRYHQLAFVQYEKNPKTGEDLNFNELNIIRAFSHRTISKYAYALHDKDDKIAGDESHPDIDIGEPIPNHWQGAIYSKNGVTINKLAEWLGIPAFLIKVLHGRDAFIDYVGYLPHDDAKQQALGKHLYDDNEIKANFDWRTEVNIYRQRQKDSDLLYLDNKQYYRHKVLYDGLTLRQIAVENPDAYRTDFQALEKYRLQYLLRFAELPSARINYYVTGRGGVGKGLISRAVARNLYPDLKNDDDIFFEVGGNNVTFEGYDGQPVIIWNDCRALTLLRSLGGRENVFNVFDTHPTNCRQNVKFGSIRLVNQVNIVNSVDSYSEFLDGLAGEYKDKDGTLRKCEDKGQSYRRFPIIIPLHEEDFDILLNKGVLEGTKEYQQFVEHHHIRGNLEKINRRLYGYEQQIAEIEAKVVAPIVEAHHDLYNGLAGGNPNQNLCDILAEFEDYGTIDEDACEKDKIEKFEAFLQLQKQLIDEEINYCTDTNSFNYQRALTAQKWIKENPEEFYKRTDLHLEVTPFTGAYRP